MRRLPMMAFVGIVLGGAPAWGQTKPATAQAIAVGSMGMRSDATRSAGGDKTVVLAEMDRLIGLLGDDDFATRDGASRKLVGFGWRAMNSLVLASLDAKDEEAKVRLSSIIGEICWKTDGLSADDRKLVDDYRKGDRTHFTYIPDQSADVGLVIKRAEAIEQCHWPVNYFSTLPMAQYSHIQELRESNDREEYAWTLAAVGTWPELVEGLKGWEAGFLDPTIAVIDKLAASGKDRSATKARADLLRLTAAVSAGDSAKVLKMAEALKLAGVSEQILARRQDWKALGALPVGDSGGLISPFTRAAALQFGGDRATAREILTFTTHPQNRWNADVFLNRPILLGHLDVAYESSVAGGFDVETAKILLNQRQYREALAAYEKSETKKDGNGVDFEYQYLPALVKLNETERARQIIAKFDKLEIKGSNTDIDHWLNVADMQMGDTNGTVERLVRHWTERNQTRYLGIFADRYQEMAMWPETLTYTKPDANTIQVLGQIHDNTLGSAELIALAEKYNRSEDTFLYAITMLVKRGDHEMAMKAAKRYLEKVKSNDRPSLIQGQGKEGQLQVLCAGDWQISSLLFDGLHQRFPRDPLWTCYAGICREKSGDAAGGKRLIEEGASQLDGDIYRREFLAQTCYRMGMLDRAAEQAQLVVDYDDPQDPPCGAMEELLAKIERDRGHEGLALRHWQCATIKKGHDIQLLTDYLEFARLGMDIEARLALRERHPEAALERAQALIAADCEGLDLSIGLIKAFREAKLEDAAAALAALNRELLEAILKDFPKSHWHHFLIAKLDVETGYAGAGDVDHVMKALELAPGKKEYLELREKIGK